MLLNSKSVTNYDGLYMRPDMIHAGMKIRPVYMTPDMKFLSLHLNINDNTAILSDVIYVDKEEN